MAPPAPAANGIPGWLRFFTDPVTCLNTGSARNIVPGASGVDAFQGYHRMLIHLISGLIFLYLFVRLILPLPTGRAVKAGAGFLLLLVTQQHFLIRTFFGSMASPELPPTMIMVLGWSFVSLILLLALTLFRDLLRLGRYLAARIKRSVNPPFDRGRRTAMLGLAAVVPAAYGVGEGVVVPSMHCMEAALPRLPKALDGLTVVQVSDLHVSPLFRRSWVNKVVHLINAQNPDLILFTGDTVDGLPAHRANSVAPLKDLSARYGVFGCVGNHEYYGAYNAWLDAFHRLGITMLLNSHNVLNIKGQDLVLAGVTDVAAERFNLPMPDNTLALSGAPDGAFRIMLDHRPGAAKSHARAGVDLQLSGHTHGGQILGMDQMVARFNQGYLRGWYDVGPMKLYVNTGAGLWNGFPVRLGVPSEIARITLRSA